MFIHIRNFLCNRRSVVRQPTVRTCNCRQKNDCPLNGRCLERSLVYSASVSCPGSNTILIHLGTKRKLVPRSLQYIWKCKRNNLDFTINWDIVARTEPRRSGVRNCNLCMSEKLAIIQSDPKCTLNKRSEILGKYRLRNKFILKHSKT